LLRFLSLLESLANWFRAMLRPIALASWVHWSSWIGWAKSRGCCRRIHDSKKLYLIGAPDLPSALFRWAVARIFWLVGVNRNRNKVESFVIASRHPGLSLACAKPACATVTMPSFHLMAAN
jgi:hypothetical protein